jgi:hypothetical protein
VTGRSLTIEQVLTMLAETPPRIAALGKNEAFAEALARGLARFVTFLCASNLDATAIREPLLRRRAYSSNEMNSG